MIQVTFSPDEPVFIPGRPLFRVVGDEVFILMPDSRVHWLRNATARALWERLLESGPSGATPRALAEHLARHFTVTAEGALNDVLTFLGQLAERELVARATPPAPTSGGAD